ncbi:hypothetical protein BA195_08410 [Tenacibaculum soleae]|uniref:HEAT repeat domain-containing protein n=1 Tax=Tenacibaculum soleae TaxID=447689 RepID=A0A1B9XZC9_9FLAO|nr:hypothetical protein [Tenacibaculum soleae]OCK42918.1 hypothetical protein BA195_08410 [Tenacibaculum soleae]
MNLEHLLYTFIFFLITILVLLWGLIIYNIKKNKILERENIVFEKKIIQGIITTYSKLEVEATKNKLKRLKKYIKKDPETLWKSARIFVKINRVVKFSKEEQFQEIFKYLGIKGVLKKKIKDKDWYIKAKAIWLSYEFELEGNLQMVIPYRDVENTLVRREAQIALVSFIGWKSLVFFPYVTRPMSLWQQIRIIEKLEETTNKLDLQYLDKALLSKNEKVKELLIRVIKNFKLEQYKYYIIDQLFSDNTRLVDVAFETLKNLEITKKEIKGIKSRFLEKTIENQRMDIFNYLDTRILV